MRLPSPYPQLLVLNEKHGDSYYLIQKEGELNRALAYVLRQRYQAGWYEEPSIPLPTPEEKAEAEELAATDPSTLPKVLRSTVEDAVKKLERWKSIEEYYREELEEWEQLKAVAEAPTLKEAAALTTSVGVPYASRVMQRRRDYEYEDWNLEGLQVAPLEE